MARAFKEIGKSLNQAWQNVAEGWRELVGRCTSALTNFVPHKNEAKQATAGLPPYPRWSVLAGEVIDRDKSVVVQVELPGITREDCDISIHNRTLRIRGEKRMDRDEDQPALGQTVTTFIPSDLALAIIASSRQSMP